MLSDGIFRIFLGMYFLQPDKYADHHQNVMAASLDQTTTLIKFSCKSIQEFLANKQTNKQTDPGENITSLAEVIKICCLPGLPLMLLLF